MKRLSLFNHEKRIAAIESALENRVWYWVAVICLGAAVVGLGYIVKLGNFP
jgi:hypothetical protein